MKDNSTNLKHRKGRLILPGLLILFSSCSLFCVQNMRLNSKMSMLTNELQALESSTAEIQKELPMLRKIAEQVIVEVVPDLVPQENSEAWCSELMHFPHLRDQFKYTHTILKPRIPTQMDLPRELRDASTQILPGIIPIQVKVSIEGTLSQVYYFLNEIDLQYQKMIVSKIDLRPLADSKLFSGRIILSFPQIQYAEDIAEITRFAEESPKDDAKIDGF